MKLTKKAAMKFSDHTPTTYLLTVTDLRTDHGLGFRRTPSCDDSILTSNLRNYAEAWLHNLLWNERKCKR